MAKTNYTPEETKHTPTPWKVDRRGIVQAGNSYYSELIATTSLAPDTESALANAAFIVEACNSYDDLRSRLLAAEQERDEAKANYQFMVNRAADEKLDGYRALGARAAAAENEADRLRRSLAAAEERIAGFEESERLWAEEFDKDDDPHAATERVLRAAVRAAEAERDAWKREATSWESEVVEFGHPITPDHAHHEVRDWLNDAYAAGRAAAEGEVERLRSENDADRKAFNDALVLAVSGEASARLRNQELERLLDAGASAVEDLMTDPAWIALHKHGWAALKAWAPAARAALQPRSEERKAQG